MLPWAVFVTAIIGCVAFLFGIYSSRLFIGEYLNSTQLQSLCWNADNRLQTIVQKQDTLARNIGSMEFIKELVMSSGSNSAVDLKHLKLDALSSFTSALGKYVISLENTTIQLLKFYNVDSNISLNTIPSVSYFSADSFQTFLDRLYNLSSELIQYSILMDNAAASVGSLTNDTTSAIELQNAIPSSSSSMVQSVALMSRVSDLASIALAAGAQAVGNANARLQLLSSSSDITSVMNEKDILQDNLTMCLAMDHQHHLTLVYLSQENEDLTNAVEQLNRTLLDQASSHNAAIVSLTKDLQDSVLQLEYCQNAQADYSAAASQSEADAARLKDLARSNGIKLTEALAATSKAKNELDIANREIGKLSAELERARQELADATKTTADQWHEDREALNNVNADLRKQLQAAAMLSQQASNFDECALQLSVLQIELQNQNIIKSQQECESNCPTCNPDSDLSQLEDQVAALQSNEARLLGDLESAIEQLTAAERMLQECQQDRAEHADCPQLELEEHQAELQRCELESLQLTREMESQLKSCMETAETCRVANDNMKYEYQLLSDSDQNSRQVVEDLETRLQLAEFNVNSAIEERNNLETERQELVNSFQESERLVQDLADRNDNCEANLMSLQREMSIVQERIAQTAEGTRDCSAPDQPDLPHDQHPLPVRRTDYAAKAVGGSIMRHLTSPTYTPNNTTIHNFMPKMFLGFLGIEDESSVGSPEDAIDDDMRVGSCWPMMGSSGTLVIKLPKPIVVDSVSIAHLSRDEAVNPNTAPREFEVFGRQTLSDKFRFLLKGKYNLVTDQQQRSQYFPATSSFDTTPVQYIYLEITNNHGSPEYTCLYRVMVHGYSPQPARQF